MGLTAVTSAMLLDAMAVPGFGSLHALSHVASMVMVQSVAMGLIMEALILELINVGNMVFTIFLFLWFIIIE